MKIKDTSEPEIHQALAKVRHPEIDRTLVELGMIKDVSIDVKKIILTLALPLMGIPIEVKDYLMSSIRQAITNLDMDLEVTINLTEMNPEERTKFLVMAQEGWLG